MGLYQHIRKAWKHPQDSLGKVWTERLIAWRKEETTVRVEHPTRLDRARSLGYKAKQGYVIIRQRVMRGGHRRPRPSGGRRSKRFGTRLNLRKNYQMIAEERAQDKFRNLVVLNSYEVARDGKHYWYEIIFVDPSHPVIQSDPKINWICERSNQNRVFQGKTSAGKKMRGMQA